MASNRAMTPSRRPRTGRWLGLALAVLLGAVATARAQDAPRTPKARDILKTAIDTYKREDYEVASYLFAQAQERRNELEMNERQDLENFAVQNRMALKARQEGADQLRQADEALKRGRTAEAAALLKALTVNRYLSPSDCQLRATLTTRLQAAGSGAAPGGKGDAKALLTAARAALKEGKLDQADLLVHEAEKAGAGTSWLQPWADTPAKVRSDIARERAKSGTPTNVAAPLEPPMPKMTSPYVPQIAQAPSQPSPLPPVGPSVDLPPPPVITPPAKLPVAAAPAVPPAVQSPAPLSKPNPVAVPDEIVIARKMIADGFKALQAGDLETARQMALQVRKMQVELSANELGPDQLMQEVQKKTQAIAAPKAKAASAPQISPAEARTMLHQARVLLNQHKIDDAERLCNQAAAVPNTNWGLGLFEDTPERLHNDIQRARAFRDRAEADRLLVEARKQFGKGEYDDAKKKAWRAQDLHGPYSPFDFGDRPQRLLAEIAKAESAQVAQARKSGDEKAKALLPGTQVAEKQSPALPNTTDPVRAHAVALIAEARELDRRGMIVDARQKVLEAKQTGAAFKPGDPDAPDAMLLALSAKCKGHIDMTLARVAESVGGKAGDMARVQQAQAELNNARQLALAFGLDTVPIEQRMAWVQQTAAAVPAPAVPAPVTPAMAVPQEIAKLPGLPPVDPVQYHVASSPAVDGKQKEALDKLDLARLELRRANCKLARTLAEEAFKLGAEREATVVLRDIDAEEHNQRVLTAMRTFDAGVDAYIHGDFAQAASILGALDLVLLPVPQQQRLREIMSSREMLVPAGSGEKVVLTAGKTDKAAPGTASVGDIADDPLINVKAMEQIQFQQMQSRNMQAQKSALDLFKMGQKMKAVEMLTDQLAQIDVAQLSPDATRQLRSPIEKRLSEFRMVMAQDLLAEGKHAGDRKLGNWDEGKYQDNIRKRQEEVRDILQQCQALNKEHKFKESLALAYKAHELDPDNVAANMAIQMLTTRINQQKGDDLKAEVEDWFEGAMRDIRPGMRPTDEKPMRMSDNALKRFASRTPSSSIMEQRRNPKERAIEYRLEQPLTFGFHDAPLTDVINSLSALSQIPIYADEKALREANIGLEQPLSMDCNGLSMKSGLKILLDKIGLTYVIRDESLLITTADKARQNFRRAVYPVADLIIPIEDHPVPEVFDLQKAMERQIASQYMLMNYVGQSPISNLQFGLPPVPPSPPASAYDKGIGSAFGTASPGQPQSPGYSPLPKGIKHTGLEDLLVDLIKSTIQPTSWKDMGGPGTIQYFPMGMALVINQTQEVQGDVEDLLKALRRLLDMEISIEMRLVLVSESFYERIGVDFDVNLRTPVAPGVQNQLLNSSFAPFGQVNRNLNFNNVLVGLTPAGTLTPDLNVPITNSSYNFSVPPFGGYTAPSTDGGISLGLAFLSEIQVFMILEAAQGDSRTNIMMAPKITVFNGQNAFITVSTQQWLNLGITAFPVNGQILFIPQNTPIPFGTTLSVTPVVSADRRFVRLNMVPNIAQLINGNFIPAFPEQIPLPNTVDGPLGLGVPVGQPIVSTTFQAVQQPLTSSISLNTTVNVPDGGTVLLGGLKVMQEGRNEAGPPILSKIPYLDRLFRNVGWGRDATSLMIMVTPRIIINEEEEQMFLGNIAPIPRP